MQQGDRIQDRYLLEESLGKGGMAEVWRARDERLERSVAIKFLAPQLTADPEFLVRFFSEAQSIARISHANVVSVLDFGETGDTPYLVMEHVPGGAVTELAGEPIQPERAAEIVRDAALGTGAAHELGIVHRDIKPGNILLCDDGRATIADFGIALSAFSEKLTATGQVIGSPHYISPEQAAGKGSRTESDVYALGVVLYELLTGKPPFDADNATAIAIAHVDTQPEPPSARGADIDATLDALVLRCLAKDPEARFANGTALASALEQAVPSIAGLAPVAEAALLAPVVTDTAPREVVESDSFQDEPTGMRTGALVTSIVLLALLLGAGAWAMLGGEDPETPSVASASGDDKKPDKKPKPSPSGYTDGDGDRVAAGSTPGPTPSSKDEGNEQDADSDSRRGSERNGSGYYRGEGQEEEPEPETSPTPEYSPSPAESAEPTPAPAPSEPPE